MADTNLYEEVLTLSNHGRARSCTWWDSLKDLYTIHIYAHPEYGTRIEWSDGNVEEL